MNFRALGGLKNQERRYEREKQRRKREREEKGRESNENYFSPFFSLTFIYYFVLLIINFYHIYFIFFYQLTPGITMMTNWFNQCSFGISFAILSLSSTEQRGEAIQKAIETAVECEKVS